jgi:hypothetical protein
MAPKAYAAERLEAAGETAAVRRRHALWVLNELARAEARWPAATPRAWLDEQMGLVDEVRGAAAWAVSEAGDLDIALALACDSAALWFRYSLTYEGRALAEAVQRGLAARGGFSDEGRMRLGAALGVGLMYTRAPNGDVVQAWSEVLRLAQARGDGDHQMLAHWGLWLMAAYRGDPAVKLTHAEAFVRLTALAPTPRTRPPPSGCWPRPSSPSATWTRRGPGSSGCWACWPRRRPSWPTRRAGRG